MKKIIVCVSAILLGCSFGMAQSISIIDPKSTNDIVDDTLLVKGFPGDIELSAHLQVKQSSGDSMHVDLRRFELDYASGMKNYYCWKECYLPVLNGDQYQWEAPESRHLANNEVDENFNAYLRPEGNLGYSLYLFTLFDENNAADSSNVYIAFDVHPAGDVDGDYTINNGEIAGDMSGNGVVNGNEIAGDWNGDMYIDPATEVEGDTNGNGVIDGNEVEGDTNGNGVIDGAEGSTYVEDFTENVIRLFPQPATGLLNINGGQNASYSIHSVTGQKVDEGIVRGAVNVEFLSEGTYVLTLRNDSEMLLQTKFVKQ